MCKAGSLPLEKRIQVFLHGDWSLPGSIRTGRSIMDFLVVGEDFTYWVTMYTQMF